MVKSRQFLICISLLASVSIADVDLGIKAQGFGGAFRAVASSNDIIFYNPAGLTKESRMGIEADYKVATDSRTHQMGVSVVDSSTSTWGVGLAYNASVSSIQGIDSTHLLYLATSTPIIGHIISFGTGFSYFYDPNKHNDPYSHFFNLDFGLMLNLPAGVSIAVVVDHFLEPKGSEKALGLSSAGAFDLGAILPIVPLTIAFDWTMDNVSSAHKLDHVVSAGLQYSALNILPIRIGLKSSIKDDTNVLSMGAGVALAGFGIDGLYQQNLSVGRIRHFGVSLSFKM